MPHDADVHPPHCAGVGARSQRFIPGSFGQFRAVKLPEFAQIFAMSSAYQHRQGGVEVGQMQQIRSFDHDDAALVGWGVRVLLVTSEGPDGMVARRLAGLGGRVECLDELFTALSQLIDDPYGYGLLVVECDGFGGLDVARKSCRMLGEEAGRVPVILVTRDCPAQVFPPERHSPVVLRAPLSAVSLRVGFEHALRDRLALRMI